MLTETKNAYFASTFFLRWFLRLFFRCKVLGLENIPLNCPIIIAANHVSYLDPPAVSSFVPRQVHFMAKEALFKIPILATFLSITGNFPIRRGTFDRKAIKTALLYLSQGEVVGLFPEGKRVAPGDEAEGELGAALLAYKSKAKIVPAAIIGTQPWWQKKEGFGWFSKIIIKYGPPLDLAYSVGEKSQDVVGETSQDVVGKKSQDVEGKAQSVGATVQKEKEILEENTRRIMAAIKALKES